MNNVSLFDAKNRLSALIDQVEDGVEVTITRRGKAVAKLVRAGGDPPSSVAGEFRKLRDSIAAKNQSSSQDEIRRDRDEGRR